ncbi:MAG: 1-acyl-sn-glycerol-3-phosphate acyltransferase, partial [Chitinophagales bacterium]
IAGNFKIKPYQNASNILPILFSRLLNAMSPKTLAGQAPVFQERLKITGNIPMIRELAKKGTVMIVPTHSSNLDSILVGWGMHALGLPAFIYGAGLNLFNWSWFGYLMGNLGPYRLDRRKKNKFYLQTLKDYALLNLQHGCHSIFFPGGTRSRSGKIEDKLKLGLVGTAFEAQRQSFMNPPAIDVNPNALKNGNKIFVVPLVINYHFVLEASSLIDQHLKRMGQEKYYIQKERFPPLRTVANFVWKSLKARSEAILALGTPMDIFGNNVDAAGNSIAPNGQFIDMKSYYISNGEFKLDAQRDQEYTRILGEKIQQQYYQKNTVLSSNLVAFAAFELLDRRHRRSDLFDLLRLLPKDREIPYQQFAVIIARLKTELQKMSDKGEIQLAEHIHQDVDSLIKHGIKHLGVYHSEKPLKFTKNGNVTSSDMNLLYFYHNRLVGYELEKMI